MSSPLPQPITTTDALLVAVHDRLGEILDRLPAQAPSPGREDGAVELREPATKPTGGSESGGEASVSEPRPARTTRKATTQRPRGGKTTK